MCPRESSGSHNTHAAHPRHVLCAAHAELLNEVTEVIYVHFAPSEPSAVSIIRHHRVLQKRLLDLSLEGLEVARHGYALLIESYRSRTD
jgi:hypothetical protein